MQDYMSSLMADVMRKNPAEPEFHQAVQEVAESLALVLGRHPEYRHARVLERIIEPERVILFRVPWMDDAGKVQINRGFRIEMSSAIGPYKGGLRFHPSVNLGILKFLAFEQVFKNSLTTLPMGGGKGGSDFDPKGKSDNEVMRFCQSFMRELFRHIGPDTDVPAGDIGVGGREIGYLFGQYKRLRERVHRRADRQGAGLGRLADTARGHGLRVRVLRRGDAEHAQPDAAGQDVPGLWQRQRGAVYGQKLIQLGARAVTLRDSSGHVYDEAGIDAEKLRLVMELKNTRRGRIAEYAEHFRGAVYTPITQARPQPPLGAQGRLAFPSATQNEIGGKDAKNLVKNG